MPNVKHTSYINNCIAIDKYNLREVGNEFTVVSVEDDIYYTDLVVCRTSLWPQLWTLNIEFGERKGGQIKSAKLSFKAHEYRHIGELITMVLAKHARSVKRWEKQ